MSTNTMHCTRDDFVERIGLIAQGEGLPRIAGRLFGLLVFEGEAIAFGHLADRLQVSRGSISTSTRLLEDRGLIRRTARPGERQEYFELAADPYVSLLDGARRRTRTARDEIRRTIDDVPETEHDLRRRLAAYADFYDAIDCGLNDAVKRLSADD